MRDQKDFSRARGETGSVKCEGNAPIRKVAQFEPINVKLHLHKSQMVSGAPLTLTKTAVKTTHNILQFLESDGRV